MVIKRIKLELVEGPLMSVDHIPHLTAYCDADWVVFPNTRKLVTCFVFEVWLFSL